MSSATHEPLGKRWATGENPPPCTVCERRQPSSRASNIKRVTSLAARVAQLEAQQASAKPPAAAPISTTAAQEWFENAANEQEKKLDDRLKEFGHSIKKALTTLRQEQAEELYTSKASTVEEVKSISEALRSIQERQSALEAKLANMMQQTALRAAGVASSGTGGRLSSSASSSSSSSAGPVAPSPHEAHLAAHGGNPAGPATAAANVAAAAASKAFTAAEKAETSANEMSRTIETTLSKMSRAVADGELREKRLNERIETLTAALAEQRRAQQEERKTHMEELRGLAMRMEAIERWNPTPSAPAGAAKTLRVTATAPAGTSGRPTASRAK
jgi:hypothetical protein